MKKFAIIASALAILATPAFAATAKHHHKHHYKVAQGPAGLTAEMLGDRAMPRGLDLQMARTIPSVAARKIRACANRWACLHGNDKPVE